MNIDKIVLSQLPSKNIDYEYYRKFILSSDTFEAENEEDQKAILMYAAIEIKTFQLKKDITSINLVLGKFKEDIQSILFHSA